MKNSILFLFTIAIASGSDNCNYHQTTSACVENCGNVSRCVDSMALLVGGSNLAGWRKEAEIISGDNFHIQIADFPYIIDAPYGFWGGPKLGVVVCGGKNWEDDVVETRCWNYDQCADQWNMIFPDMPVASSGGVGVPVQDKSGDWSLWIIGGGNGVNAIGDIQILSAEVTVQGKELVWRAGEGLVSARYGHCAVYHHSTNRIVIIGGRNNDEVHRSMEVLDPVNGTVEVVPDWTTPTSRWGHNCQYYEDIEGQPKIALMGGMDSYFIPHSDAFSINLGNEAEKLPELPWSSAGCVGVALNGNPTIIGGFSLLGFKHGITSWEQDNWITWDTEITSSRVSGLAIAVPRDLLDYC